MISEPSHPAPRGLNVNAPSNDARGPTDAEIREAIAAREAEYRAALAADLAEMLAAPASRGGRPLVVAWGGTAEERAAFVDGAVPPGTHVLRFTADPSGVAANRARMGHLFGVEGRRAGESPSFRRIFAALLRREPAAAPMLIHIENVPYLLRDPARGLTDHDLPSEFNAEWESPYLPPRAAQQVILLSGDSVDVMRGLLRGDQPLYGRASWLLDLRSAQQRAEAVIARRRSGR